MSYYKYIADKANKKMEEMEMTNFNMNELVNILNKAIEGFEKKNQEIDNLVKRDLAWELLDMHHEHFKVYEARVNKFMEQLDNATSEKEIERLSRQIDNAVDNQEYILNQLLSKTKKVS